LVRSDPSDPSGPVNPVNSCIFATVLYFPVFYTVFSCVYSFIHEVWSTWNLHYKVFTSFLQSTVASVYPVDQYWAKVLAMRTAAGDLKYKTLGKAVMASLALSHGNADAERGFSANKKVVTADRSRLCEGTINAVRLLKDAMRCHYVSNTCFGETCTRCIQSLQVTLGGRTKKQGNDEKTTIGAQTASTGGGTEEKRRKN